MEHDKFIKRCAARYATDEHATIVKLDLIVYHTHRRRLACPIHAARYCRRHQQLRRSTRAQRHALASKQMMSFTLINIVSLSIM